MQDIGIGADVVRESLERGCEPHDADRGLVEHLVARGAVDLDRLHLAVGLDRDGELQRPVDAAHLRFLGVVEGADALDLEPPVVDVLREAVFLRARADEAALRALLVGLEVAPDLRFQPRDLEALLHEVARLGVGLGRAGRDRFHDDRGLRLHARHELLRLGLELLHARLGGAHLLARVARVDAREGAARAQFLVGVAAALEVRLRERIGLVGPLRALRVDEHDFHHVVRRIPLADAGDLEADADDEQRVERRRGDDRDLHRRDEPEAFEQKIGEGNERVLGRLPQLHLHRQGGLLQVSFGAPHEQEL